MLSFICSFLSCFRMNPICTPRVVEFQKYGTCCSCSSYSTAFLYSWVTISVQASFQGNLVSPLFILNPCGFYFHLHPGQCLILILTAMIYSPFHNNKAVNYSSLHHTHFKTFLKCPLIKYFWNTCHPTHFIQDSENQKRTVFFSANSTTWKNLNHCLYRVQITM